MPKYEEVNFVDSTKPVGIILYLLMKILKISGMELITVCIKNLAHIHLTVLNKDGYYFSVWAPNATLVSVVGDFNNWNESAHVLFVRLEHSGIWEGFIPGYK